MSPRVDRSSAAEAREWLLRHLYQHRPRMYFAEIDTVQPVLPDVISLAAAAELVRQAAVDADLDGLIVIGHDAPGVEWMELTSLGRAALEDAP